MKGASDLLLCAAVMAACWTRTPFGPLAGNVLAHWTGREPVPVLSRFHALRPAEIHEELAGARRLRVGALPPGWSPGLAVAVSHRLGPGAVAGVGPISGDPEEALETWVVGADARARAVSRARAAGERHPERLAAHRRYLPEAAALRARVEVEDVLALASALDLRWPLSGPARVSSPFGWRRHPVLGGRRFHEGVDLAVPEGTPVLAAGPGVVIEAGADAVNGRYVVIDHGHGVHSAYCHGRAVEVRVGQAVRAGQPVMESGSSGRATGPHLHFGVRIGGRAVDPEVVVGRGQALAPTQGPAPGADALLAGPPSPG